MLLFTTAVALYGAQAHAEAISYSLMMCESLDVLKDPMNKKLAMNAAWKPQHTLMLQRTAPYMELRNTSEEAEITQFMLTIGDMSKDFDWAQLIEASPGVTFSLITPDGIGGGAKSDTLVIDFQGFEPGDFVRFRTGLSPDTGSNMIVDYRMTLFQLDGSDTSNNATVTVNFTGEEGDESLVDQLPNFEMGMPTATTMGFNDHYMDMIMPFSITDEGTIEPPDPGEPAVPEPTSSLLLASGLVGLVGWRWQRRRAQRSARS